MRKKYFLFNKFINVFTGVKKCDMSTPRKATVVSVCLLLGVFLGRIVSVYHYFAYVLPFAVVASGIFFKIITKKIFLLAVCIAFALGAAASVIDARFFGAKEIDGNFETSGRVCGTRSDGKTVLENLTFDGEKVRGKAVVRLDKDYAQGATVTFGCNAETYEVDVFDGYSAALYCDGIYYNLRETGEIHVDVGETTVFEKAKKKMTDAIKAYMGEENAGIMKSLLFGDKSDLSEETGEAINGIGMAHIFAVSGLHIGFLAALLMKILRKLRVRRDVSLAVVFCALLFYGAVTGFPAGVKRATIMTVVSGIAKLTARKNDSLTTLSLSAAIITVTNPRELFDLGFIMSFAAVLGIICFYKPIYRAMTRRVRNKVFGYVAKILSTTISANMFMLPISFNTFGSLSLYAPIANLVILPIISVVFPVAACAAILSLAFFKAGTIFFVMNFALDFIRKISETIYLWKYSVIEVNGMGVSTAFYVAALIAASRFVGIKKKYKYPIVGALGAAMIISAVI